MATKAAHGRPWAELAEAAHYDAKELAALCQLSVRQLQREFRRCMGQTPQEWLNERRIIVAREKLLAGVPVKVVAIELGFKQASHFCRQFKSLNQMTPTEFVLMQGRNGEACRLEITNVAGG